MPSEKPQESSLLSEMARRGEIIEAYCSTCEVRFYYQPGLLPFCPHCGGKIAGLAEA